MGGWGWGGGIKSSQGGLGPQKDLLLGGLGPSHNKPNDSVLLEHFIPNNNSNQLSIIF